MAAHLAWQLERLQAIGATPPPALMGRDQLGRDFFARGQPESVAVTRRTEMQASLLDLMRAYARLRTRDEFRPYAFDRSDILRARRGLGTTVRSFCRSRLIGLILRASCPRAGPAPQTGAVRPWPRPLPRRWNWRNRAGLELRQLEAFCAATSARAGKGCDAGSRCRRRIGPVLCRTGTHGSKRTFRRASAQLWQRGNRRASCPQGLRCGSEVVGGGCQQHIRRPRGPLVGVGD